MKDVPALRQGLAVLAILARHGKPLAAAAIAFELGIPRSSAYRLLGELCLAEFAQHHAEDQRYGLGPAVVPLADSYRAQITAAVTTSTNRTRGRKR